jgi:hypothetical protein
MARRAQNQQSAPKCAADLPLENEPIDVLVDTIRGLYVQGGVASVDRDRCGFTVTYLSADGYPLEKSFHALSKSDTSFRKMQLVAVANAAENDVAKESSKVPSTAPME